MDLVLAPLDASERALTAAEYAVAIADRYDADLHALYVLEEEVAHSLDSGAIEVGTVAAETREFMAAVEELVGDSSVTLSHSSAMAFMQTQLTHHPGSVVLDTAEQKDADFLVVPRSEVADDPDAVLGKAAEYVLMYASQPVLSV
jgi:nucleotide-binding universal stress UspA family protein